LAATKGNKTAKERKYLMVYSVERVLDLMIVVMSYTLEGYIERQREKNQNKEPLLPTRMHKKSRQRHLV